MAARQFPERPFHINTFEKGMTSDVSPLLQPEGTYRYAKNVIPISQDGNNYTIKDCLGNTKIFNINIPYSGTIATNATRPIPICFISFPGRLIVFSTNNDTEAGGYGEIGEIKYLPYGQGIKPLSVSGEKNAGYVPIYHHADLLFSRFYKIEGYAFPESETIQRIYWTDNFNEPRVINIADSIYSTYIASGSLEVNKYYMVLEGDVRYPVGLGNPEYGPGLSAGNIFQCTATTTYDSMTSTNPTPKVIEYNPIELLAWTPDKALGNIKFQEYGLGNVNCGNKVYFYRLSAADGAVTTAWSPPSFPVHVGGANTPTNLRIGVDYTDFVGSGNSTTLINSLKSVKVTVGEFTSLDLQRWGSIELAVAEYDQLIDAPRQVIIVDKRDLTSTALNFDNTITLEHTGSDIIGTLSVNDLTAFPAPIRKLKTITTNKNYNLGGNATERAQIDMSAYLANVTMDSYEYPMPTAYDFQTCGQRLNPFTPLTGVNPVRIAPWARYLVDAPGGGYVTYAANPGHASADYYDKEVFIGVTGTYTYTTTGVVSSIRPVAHKNRYTKQTDGSRTEDCIEITGENGVGFFDLKEPAVHHHCTPLWSGETYRWAFLGFDKKGVPFYAQHIQDFAMPTVQDKGGIVRYDDYDDGSGTAPLLSMVGSGVTLSNLFIPDSILDQLDGFMIVRAERAARIIAQGIVQNVTVDVSGNSTPCAWTTTPYDVRTADGENYVFICPDHLVDYPFKSDLGIIGGTMEEAFWVAPGTEAAPTTAPYHYNSNANVTVKLTTDQAADGASPRSAVVEFWTEASEDESVSLPSGIFNNNMEVGADTTTQIDCAPQDLNTYKAVGGKKIVFRIDSPFTAYNSAANYTDGGSAVKIVMNYVNNAGGSYGAIENTNYISTGHFQPITDQVRIDCAATVNGETGCLFNDMEVMGGDCYPCLVDYGYGLYYYDVGTLSYSYGWYFPCECNSNYNLRHGRKVSNAGLFEYGTTVGEQIIWLDSGGTITNLESFSYNEAYSSEGQATRYPNRPANFISNTTFLSRLYFAGPKVIGEIVDSFRPLQTLDYHDLDVQGGQINKIAVKDGRLIVWQDKFDSTVPILERQLLSAISGAATTIGTGGVVDRFDPITSRFGTQHQHSVIETENGFVWFDMRQKAFMHFDTSILEVSNILGLKGFFDEVFLESIGSAYAASEDMLDFINPPDFNSSCDRPLRGTGITGWYDPKFKMTYMTFKFKRRSYNVGDLTYDNPNLDFTIGYYHPRKVFVGFFDCYPAIAHNHNQIVVSANNPKNISKYYASDMAATDFEAGDIIDGGDNQEYMCYLAATGMTYSSPPNATYFTRMNSTHEIWVHNQPEQLELADAPGYIYNSIFGLVVNNEIIYIVNPKTMNPFTVLAWEQNTSPTTQNYTDVEISNDTQSGADNDIDSYNTDYNAVWDGIAGTMPLDSNGARLVARYLKVRLVKKNWSQSPLIVSAATKILRFIKSFYVEKR